MSRDVCGICWCPYDDDGKCGCKPEQPEALRIADQLDDAGIPAWMAEEAAAELRRLHAENVKLKAKADVAEAGYRAAVSKACWQESTNRELNNHIEQKVQLRMENDALRKLASDAAELRRLHELYEQARHKAVRMIEANDTWAEKTQWVQDTVQPEELGMHRADVLKQRIDRLVNTLAETHSAYQANLLADEALLQQALEALEFAAENVFCEHDDDLIGVTRKALQERLK